MSIALNIEIHRNETSRAIVYSGVINAFTKGGMYVVLLEKDGEVVSHKYPMCSLFRVIESYEGSRR